MITLADTITVTGTGTGTGTAALLQDNRLLWFVNRGTGVVLLVLLTLSVALGVMSTLRATSRWWPRFVTQALHRNISLLALALLGAHVATAVADEYVKINWYDAFIPFGETYRPLWGSLGTIALDLMVIAIVTSLARHRFGHRRWRAIHLTTYLCWLLGLIHGIGIGTDQRTTWSVMTTAICIGVVIGATMLRLSTRGQEPSTSTQSIPVLHDPRADESRRRTSRAGRTRRAERVADNYDVDRWDGNDRDDRWGGEDRDDDRRAGDDRVAQSRPSQSRPRGSSRARERRDDLARDGRGRRSRSRR